MRIVEEANNAAASMRLPAGIFAAGYFLQRKIDKFTTVILLLVFLIFVQLDKKEKLSNI